MIMCVTCFLLSIKLKCFSNFMVCVCVNNQKSTPMSSSSSSSSLPSLSFLGVYKRGLRGGSRFVWCPATLGIIIRGFFQFHRSGPRLPLFRIAPHLRSLIRERVKLEVCVWGDDYRWHDWAADRFDLVCDRWVRLPSIRAVLLKLQECSRYTHLVISTDATNYSLRDEGIMSDMFYVAMTREMSMMRNSHNLSCSSHRLPAVPRPSSGGDVAALGYCFTCGAGLSDKTDFNLVPMCPCVVGAGDMLLCSNCVDE